MGGELSELLLEGSIVALPIPRVKFGRPGYGEQCLPFELEAPKRRESLPLGQQSIKDLEAVIVKVPSGLNSAMSVPCHRVIQPRLNCDYTDRTEPALALLGVSSIGLLNRKLHAALYNSVRE